MKKAGLLLAFVLIVALVSCTMKDNDQLIGTWQKENGMDLITFVRGGKVDLVCSPAKISTTYRAAKDKLQLDLGILGTSSVKYAVTKDVLTITDAQGKEVKYVRQAPKPAEPGKEAKPAGH